MLCLQKTPPVPPLRQGYQVGRPESYRKTVPTSAACKVEMMLVKWMFFSASNVNRCSYTFLICHLLIWDCITVSFSSLQVALLFDENQVLKLHTEVKCSSSSSYCHYHHSCALPWLWGCSDATDRKSHHPQPST